MFLQFVFRGCVRIEEFFSFLLGPVFHFFLSRIRPVYTSVQQTPVSIRFVYFLQFFLLRSIWKFSTEFPSPFVYRFVLPHVGSAQPVFYRLFTGVLPVVQTRSAKENEEKPITPVFVTLKLYIIRHNYLSQF